MVSSLRVGAATARSLVTDVRAPRRQRAGWLALFALALTSACGSSGGGGPSADRVTATITSVTPQAGFVPADVQFVGDYSAVEGVDASSIQASWDFGDGAGSNGAFSVSHTYDQAGTFTATLTVREVTSSGGTRSESTAETTVTVYPKAELRVGTPFVSQAAVRSQDDLRVTYDLFNDAGEVPVPFQVSIYLARPNLLNPANPPDTATLHDLVLEGRMFVIDSVSVDSFGGEGTQQNFDRQGIRVPGTVPSGDYDLLVYADDQGVIGEFDESNNVAFAPQQLTYINTTSEGPDLSVSNVRARPSRTNLLDQVTVDFEVDDNGTEGAVLFDYAVYLSFTNDTLETDDRQIGTGSIEAVAAGGNAKVTSAVFTLDPPEQALGSYFVLVVADSGDTVEEVNESNNVGASNAIVVTDEPIPGTDLVPTQFTFDPQTTFLDGSVTLRASVLNQGSEAAPQQFFCRVYLSSDDQFDPIDDRQLDSINFPALDAGEELEVDRISRIPGFFDPGQYYLFLSCDPNFQIPEADEDNNVLIADGRLEISTDPEIDLRLGSFDIQPRTVDNEADLTVTMSVCNDGTNGAGPSIARVIISADTTLDQSDTVLLETVIDSVDAGQCVNVQQSVPAVCDTFQPNYNVFAVLDATNLLPETNETNNTVALDSPLTINGVICQCTVDPLERNANGVNNSPATPTFVTARTYTGLTMCDVAVDWYAVPLEQGETVRAIITFDNDRGNLDMTLYATDRATVLDSSTSDGDREEVIAFVVPETGDYLLKVFGRTASDVNAYDMTIEVTPPLSGTDLIVTGVTLSNTNPVLAQAVDVTFDVINLGDVPAGQSTARIYISDDIEIDPAVDPQLGEVVISDVPAVGLRRRTVTVHMPGDGPGGPRYIGVVADALNEVPGEIDETNNTSFSDLFNLDAGCFDSLEPNNSIEDAYHVTLTGATTTLSGLLVCTENVDYYDICGQAGDFLTMRAQFDGELNDIDLRLYNQDGTLIDRSEGTGSEEVIQIDYLSADRCYTLEVLVIGADREAPYDLVIQTGDAPPELICSGAAEPNDSFGTAAPLGQNLEGDLAVCPVSDVDYYSLNVSAGTPLTFRFLPAGADSSVPDALRMSLWGPSRNFLANTVSATEPLVFTTVSTGKHYLRVTSLASGPRNQGYRLSVEGLDGIDLEPVDLAIEPQVAALGDRVQYTFSILNNRTLASGPFSYGVYLSDDPVIDPQSDLLLRTESEASLPGAGSVDVGNKVTIPTGAGITTGALHFLGVYVDPTDAVDEFAEANNVALVPLQILAECPPDAAEPNDVRADWADLGSFESTDLTLCGDDVDWFRLSVTGSTSYTISSSLVSGDGDLDLFVYDTNSNLLASAETLSSDEQVTFTTPVGASAVYLAVEPFGQTQLTYQLQVSP